MSLIVHLLQSLYIYIYWCIKVTKILSLEKKKRVSTLEIRFVKLDSESKWQ